MVHIFNVSYSPYLYRDEPTQLDQVNNQQVSCSPCLYRDEPQRFGLSLTVDTSYSPYLYRDEPLVFLNNHDCLYIL